MEMKRGHSHLRRGRMHWRRRKADTRGDRWRTSSWGSSSGSPERANLLSITSHCRFPFDLSQFSQTALLLLQPFFFSLLLFHLHFFVLIFSFKKKYYIHSYNFYLLFSYFKLIYSFELIFFHYYVNCIF